MEEPITLNLSNFQNACDSEGIKFSIERKKGKAFTTPSDRQIRKYLAQPEGAQAQIVKSYSRRPLLTRGENGKAAILVQTFAPALGVIVLGNEEQKANLEISFGDAAKFLSSYLSHWKFKTESDCSRALAQLFTPALLQGGFITRPVPVFLIASDKPAAGKTIWHQFACRIYQEKAIVKAHSGSSVGGTDDMLKASIKYGDSLCFIDEIRALVDSPLLNAIVTGQEEADIRSAHEKAIRASIDHLIVFLAGVRKDFSFEGQLATRVMPIQILLDTYKRAPDGRLLEEWVNDNSLRLLGAIYSILRAWIESGSPLKSINTRFPAWSGAVNGILEMLGMVPVTQELARAQNELANSDLAWLENIVSALREEKLFWEGTGKAESVSPGQIREFLISGGYPIPGAYNPNAPNAYRLQNGIISRALQGLPRHKQTPRVTIFNLGEIFVHCYCCGKNEKGRMKYSFLFSNTDLLPGAVSQYEGDMSEMEL
jgi:hypothetical protein